MRILVPSLENSSENYRLCLHDRDFALGSMIVDNIVHCIDKSRRVIIVLSQHFVKSKWCQWELDMANHKSFEDSSCFLILIQLEILERRALPRHLKLLMDTRTYLEWPDKKEAETNTDVVFKRLKDAMGPSIRQVEHTTTTLSIEASA
ncbi:toll-like receptor 2 [Anabrus simplex]|uniref:toll-like receptor 2 n=1 Tax=Anabrus simplex TaxID=316456 RepID=UPI0034DCCD06